jgi:hypothetical protein
LPSHLGVVPPHSLQVKMVLSLAMPRIILYEITDTY